MIAALIDTTVTVDYLRGHLPAKQWILGLEQSTIAIHPLTWAETMIGARNRSEQDQIRRFLKQFVIEHPTVEDNRWAMRQLSHLHLSHGLGINDAFIASIAVRLDVPLYTNNLKHFAPLPQVDERRPY